MHDILLSFGDGNIATVRPSGVVDIRMVDDREHRTSTVRIRIDEFARIAKTVFDSVKNDSSNKKSERDTAGYISEHIQNFEQIWIE